MSFTDLWQNLRTGLAHGETIPNWTAAHGYLGDSFRIVSITPNGIEVDAPGADTIQRVTKKDMEFMYECWEDYCAGRVKRTAVVKHTRVSKYSMSILKHFESMAAKK